MGRGRLEKVSDGEWEGCWRGRTERVDGVVRWEDEGGEVGRWRGRMREDEGG